MDWQINITDEAEKVLSKLSLNEAKQIYKFLNEKLQKYEHPRATGKALKGNLRDYWRYRVGNYRIVCQLQDKVVTILVIDIGHRKEVYKK